MAKNLEVTTELVSFQKSVGYMATSLECPMSVEETLRLCKLGGGVLQFAHTVFVNGDFPLIYAQVHDREAEGRGAHFDLYHDLLHDRYPYLGVFNLSGEAKVTAAHLPDDLQKSYLDRFPEPTEASAQARRQFSAIALQDPKADIYEGKLEAGSGMVIAQRKDRPHIIHDVAPVDTADPGKFIKLAHLDGSKKSFKSAIALEMKSLDEVLTDGLMSASSFDPRADFSDFPSQVPPTPSDRLIS